HFVRQGPDENRSIEETLDIGWRLMGMLPRRELKRVRPEILEKYYKASRELAREKAAEEEADEEHSAEEAETAEEPADTA
ncbi:unnamed protein product, partial [marine sediment metagenome]